LRAGPLSDRRVIDLLNRHFVPVYIVNEEYAGKGGSASVEERAALQRVRQEGYAKKLSVGTVHAYVLDPDGHTHDSLHVASALQTSRLLAMLERAVAHFKPRPGSPIVTPARQSTPPPAPANGLVLHLISRSDARDSWGHFPAENWIALRREEWSRLLPRDSANPGQTWELDREVTGRILTYFYPQTENNDARTERIEAHSLTAKVIAVNGDLVTARVDGFVRMSHAFYPGRTAEPLQAEVVGVLTFVPAQPPTLQLVTTRAAHGTRRFNVAVSTVTLDAR